MAYTGGNGGNPDEIPVSHLTKEQFFEQTFKALTMLLGSFFKKQVNFILVIPFDSGLVQEVNFISNIKPDKLADALRHAAILVDQQVANELSRARKNP